MEYSWTALLPAAVTILIAIIFKKVAWALFLGTLSGCLAFAQWNLKGWYETTYNIFYKAFTNPEKIYISLFIIIIGILLKILNDGGAYYKFTQKISSKLNSPRRTRITTWFLSLFMFFDDYANVLICGASMRSIFHKHKISPAILAYIVDILASFASIMIISTWAAYEGSLMLSGAEEINLIKTSTELFIRSIPYHFYTYFGIFLALLVSISGKWFSYKLDNKIFKSEKNIQNFPKTSHYHLIIPISILLILSLSLMFIIGYTNISENPNIDVKLINIIGNAPTIKILFYSSLVSLLITIMMFIKGKVRSIKELLISTKNGSKEMFSVAMIILMANAMALISSKLQTGKYITHHMKDYISGDLLLPFIFVSALLVTVATGFSWTSMAIMIPVAYSLCDGLNQFDMIAPAGAAVISGAICGAQLVPYSDKTVISAAACHITPLYHAKTQFLQVTTTIFVTIIGYIIFTYSESIFLTFLSGTLLTLTIHLLFARKSNNYTTIKK